MKLFFKTALLPVFLVVIYTMIVSNTGSWVYFGNQLQLLLATELVVLLAVVVYYIKNFKVPQLLFLPLLFLYALLIFFYPVRDLNLGDGLLLLENVILEARIFGFQLTLDEIIEAFIHSRVFLLTDGDPRTGYQITSSSAGIIFLASLGIFLVKNRMGAAELLLFLGSGGMFLFHGYAENYTLTTLVIFFYTVIVYTMIQKGKRNLELLIPASLIAVAAVLFHLVSGYLVFSLVYLAWNFSDRKRFIFNSAVCSAIAGIILATVFGYFLFLADPSADRTQTIAFHPPFYPVKQLLSLKHLVEIAGVLAFNALPAAFILVYIIITDKKQLTRFLKKNENRFLISVLAGFMIHAFIHTPQLGFPADWDLMGFYWLPLTLITALIFSGIKPELRTAAVPVIMFPLIIHLINLQQIALPDPLKEAQLQKIILLTNEYAGLKHDTGKIGKNRKKFYIKTDFFIFRTTSVLASMKQTAMVNEGREYKKELDLHFHSNGLNQEWLNDFLKRLTDYHLRYLDLVNRK